MTTENAYVTKVSNTGTEEGKLAQRVEMLLKTVKIEYKARERVGLALAVVLTAEG